MYDEDILSLKSNLGSFTNWQKSAAIQSAVLETFFIPSEKFSNLDKLLRVTGYVLKFTNNCRLIVRTISDCIDEAEILVKVLI